MSEKIKSEHLARIAIVYVRQSSSMQVNNYHESKKMQYAMKEQLLSYGWGKVEIIDDDLGISASGKSERHGFNKMLSMVFSGIVGAIAARELSRFARNSKDWQQLIEVCKMVDTLLIDADVIYNPSLSNDRLLLGVKGTLAEYELDVLHQRAVAARFNKAKRGELGLDAPIGYIRSEYCNIYEITPDIRVKDAIASVFRKFFELGTVRQTLLWYISNNIELPYYKRTGKRKEILWRIPKYTAVNNILTNPVYAGIYAFGKTCAKTVFKNQKSAVVIKNVAQKDWHAFVKDHHEGYVTIEQYEQIQNMIMNNQSTKQITTQGAPKKGVALLCGILRCKRCGKKLTTAYTGKHRNSLRYICTRGYLDNGEPKCISMAGKAIDDAIVEVILNVIKPGIEDAILRAKSQYDKMATEKLRMLQLELEDATFKEHRCYEQFNNVDPKNRLVAQTLEKSWNEALNKVSDIQMKINDEQQNITNSKSVSMDDFQTLASDFHLVWEHPNTDVILKKRLIRTIIREIIIDSSTEKGKSELIIHWQGGCHTTLDVKRIKRGSHCATNANALQAIKDYSVLFDDYYIAGILSKNGLKTGNGLRWTKERVHSIKAHHSIKESPEKNIEKYVTLTNAAKLLDISTTTLRKETEKGFPCIHPLENGPWIFKISDLQSELGKKLADRVIKKRAVGGAEHDFRDELFNF